MTKTVGLLHDACLGELLCFACDWNSLRNVRVGHVGKRPVQRSENVFLADVMDAVARRVVSEMGISRTVGNVQMVPA